MDIGDEMHEQHLMHSPSVGMVPKLPLKWDTLSIRPGIEVVVDANEIPESCYSSPMESSIGGGGGECLLGIVDG